METLDIVIKKVQKGQAVSTAIMVKFLEELKERRKADSEVEQLIRNMSDKMNEIDYWCKNYKK